jgi:tRNA A-37 threonylcarbamoyl transferase component Bud32
MQGCEHSTRLSLYRHQRVAHCNASLNRVKSFDTGVQFLGKAVDYYKQRKYARMNNYIEKAVMLNNVKVIRLTAQWIVEKRFGDAVQFKWYHLLAKAAELNDAKSMYDLANVFFCTKKKIRIGLILLSKAAELNFPAAKLRLREVVLSNLEDDVNLRLARSNELLLEAVSLGDAHAMYVYAFQLLFGALYDGESRERVLHWFRLAANAGFDVASDIIAQIEQSLQTSYASDTCDEIFPEQLGIGAYAKVYAGQLDDQSTAIKVFMNESDVGAQLEVDQSVMQEITALSRIAAEKKRCANVVNLLGIQFFPEYPYIVMPRYSGSLAHFFHAGRINNLDECRQILKGICAAVTHIHQLGILHFDIKMENILLAHKRSIVPVLTDFGSSQLFPRNASELMSIIANAGEHTTPVYCAYEFIPAHRLTSIKRDDSGWYSKMYRYAFRVFNNQDDHQRYKRWLIHPKSLMRQMNSQNVQAKIVALKKLDIFSIGMIAFLISSSVGFYNSIPGQYSDAFFSRVIGRAIDRYTDANAVIASWDTMRKASFSAVV